MISLGYGRYVRSDEVAAVEPIEEGRGPRRRALVYLRGRQSPIVASRSEEAIIRDLTGDSAEKGRQQRLVLEDVAKSLDSVPGAFRRRLRERDGIDLDALVEEAHRAIA
ncbi:MAG TPA: hypothetical protein VFY10_14350 [Dehalococcoidia bacterium]|nr:hypothetical protein [Dehalococcoidia bacterium]